MLQQTAELETEAARIRVTPQELVQATAAIEARQDAHRGTIGAVRHGKHPRDGARRRPRANLGCEKNDQYSWSLSRQSGRLCVQCWVTPADATLIANGQPAYVGAYKSGDATTAITLPLERFANAIDMPANFGRGVSSVQVN